MIEQRSLLEFIRFCGLTKDKHRLAEFSCSCGNTTVTSFSRVKNGYTKSCGCLLKIASAKRKKGFRGTYTYSSWSSAKDRSLNKRSKDYHRYGAKGIGFSNDWMNYENFLRDMGERPKGTSLDRINPDKGYEKGNCRWATPIQQSHNKKNLTTINSPLGIMLIVEYAAMIGITNGAAHMRLKRGKLEGCSYAAR